MKPLLARLGRLIALIALMTVLFLAIPIPAGAQGQIQNVVSPGEKQANAVEAAQSAPLMFVENVGQTDSQARYEVVGARSTLYLAEDALWYSLTEKPQVGNATASPEHSLNRFAVDESQKSTTEPTVTNGVNLKVSFVGANPHPRLEPFNRLETHVSYFRGNDPSKWRSDVPVWGGVRYVALYPGIDLEISGDSGRLTQRMVAGPGADLKGVSMQVDGADGLSLVGNGVGLRTAVGDFSLRLIEAVTIDGAPAISTPEGPAVQGNIVAQPFSDGTLTAQSFGGAPGLVYSTFLGGSGDDYAMAITVDSSGAAYVTGSTESLDFPAGPGYDPTAHGNSDIFVAKLNPAGNALIYATYLGGTAYDGAGAIAADSSGAAYLTGVTSSSDFPVTSNAFPKSPGNNFDVVVAKLSPTGLNLVYSTYLGGDSSEYANALAVNPAGQAYVTGYTDSLNYPTTPNAYDRTNHGGSDIFLTKLDAAGSALIYSTFLGNTGFETAYGLALDASGFAYLTGYTTSSSFPTTPGAYDRSFNGVEDVCVVKLNPAGHGPADLLYSTFLGGSQDEDADALALDTTGSVYVTGYTHSTDYPTTPGAFDRSYNGGYEDVFVAKLNPANHGLADLVYSTYLGGSRNDRANGLAVDPAGAAYVAGATGAPPPATNDFPTTPGAYDRTYNGGYQNAFLARLNPAGSGLAYSTFLGGSGGAWAPSVALDPTGAAYLVGAAWSSDFPTTPGAYDRTYHGGGGDAFVTKFRANELSYLPVVLDNAYGGWTTGISVRNPATTTNTIEIVYYDSGGQVAGTDWNSVPPNGSWGIYNGGRFGGNWAGSATIFGDYPVTAVVNETGPGTFAMGYTGDPKDSTTLMLPAVMDNAYGGWTSGVSVRNTSPITASVTISFYNSLGGIAGTESKNIPGNGTWGVYQGGKFGGNWAGSAIISSNKPLVAVVNEINSGGSAVSYNASPYLSTSVYLPTILNNAYGGWTTGVGIQNPNPSPTTGTIKYYDSAGVLSKAQGISLPGRGYLGLYQGAAGLPNPFAGSAVLSMSQPVAAIVNEVGPAGDGMGYNGESSVTREVNLPVVMDNSYGGWNTGISIQNLTGSSASVTVTFYDTNGVIIGSPDHRTIPARGSVGLYQGGALGGQAGSAKIVSNQPVAVIVNEIGPGGSAISYNGTP